MAHLKVVLDFNVYIVVETIKYKREIFWINPRDILDRKKIRWGNVLEKLILLF